MFQLERLGIAHRPAALLRVAGVLGFVYWQVSVTHPAGFHGRGLVISVLLATAAVAWIRWSWSFDAVGVGPLTLTWDLYLLGITGALMTGASPAGPGNAFVFVAAFSAGARVGMPRAFFMTAASVVALCAAWILYDVGGLGVLAYIGGLLATTLGGTQRYEGQLRREQAELLLAQTQRSHQEQLRAARLEESGRIAREIHDVLAHSLAGLTIQLEATTALVEAGADADTVLPRLRRAHALAREGLAETRLAVGALRDGSDTAATVPALGRIEALVADHRALDHPIDLEIDGDLSGLGGPAGAAAVRIIQESLTNVVKHAPGARVTVRLSGGPPLSLRIENIATTSVPAAAPGGGLSASGGGYGIAGMRERAHGLGGQLDAGPTATGWRVEATLGDSAS